ncbi:MAG: sodium:solute symporter family protein, partial [Candidatus Accumulibacter sp.]|nr:sodium:solute symporter family protein [Accumulibacter sp.]
YRLNILTLGDFFRIRYNRWVEVLTTLCIIFSYLGWVSAQVKALGLVFSLITDGALSQDAGTILGAAIVLTYTSFGGMFSTAVLDFLQMIMIIAGLLFIAWIVSGMVGGVGATVAHAAEAGKLDFFPEANAVQWFSFLGAWMTMALGSIPQQDVFQRVTSAKDAKTAIYGSVLGGSIYFVFTFVPMFIAYSATLLDPEVFNGLVAHDSQLVLPTLVLNHMPVLAQSVFFGAVLSAIMSTSSATLLAPSVAFSENIVRGFFPRITDSAFLRLMRLTTTVFTCIVLVFALTSGASIFKMVENAYKVTLVGAFTPLFLGAFWNKSTTQGALFSIVGGVLSWLPIEIFVGADSLLPPQLVGFCVSLLGMIAGSLLPQKIGAPDRETP